MKFASRCVAMPWCARGWSISQCSEWVSSCLLIALETNPPVPYWHPIQWPDLSREVVSIVSYSTCTPIRARSMDASGKQSRLSVHFLLVYIQQTMDALKIKSHWAVFSCYPIVRYVYPCRMALFFTMLAIILLVIGYVVIIVGTEVDHA